MSRISIDGKPLSDEQTEAILQSVMATLAGQLEIGNDGKPFTETLRAVLALLDAAPPATSAACPNATETCSPTCAAWEGQTCNCKVAPSAVDIATVAWTTTAPTMPGFYWIKLPDGFRSIATLDLDGRTVYIAGSSARWDIAEVLGEWCPCVPPLAARGKVAT